MPALQVRQYQPRIVIGVFTKCASDRAYRGDGRPEATPPRRIGRHPRARTQPGSNRDPLKGTSSSPDEFPMRPPTGLSYDSGDYAKPLHTAARNRLDYKNLLAAGQQEARSQGRLMGIAHFYVRRKSDAMGPSPATPAGGWESANRTD